MNDFCKKFIKTFGKKRIICANPFDVIEIHPDGAAYVCCPNWTNNYSIGNIFEDSFDNIWNSQKAKDIREKMLKRDFSLCRCNTCFQRLKFNYGKYKIFSKNPECVKFCYDGTCNYSCITCRDNIYCEGRKINNRIGNGSMDAYFLQMLKGVKRVSFSGDGEPFVSRHYRSLIHSISDTYPNIKFDIHTNGSLCNEENCKELGILNKMSTVEVSIHASTPETYKKITRVGDFDNVMKNLKWLSKLKKEKIIKQLKLFFVVHKLNYQEMPEFAKLAHSLGAMVAFWGYRDWGTEFCKKYDEMAIFEETHPEFEKFREIISQDIFKSSNCDLEPKFKKIAGF